MTADASWNYCSVTGETRSAEQRDQFLFAQPVEHGKRIARQRTTRCYSGRVDFAGERGFALAVRCCNDAIALRARCRRRRLHLTPVGHEEIFFIRETER